MSVTNDEVQHIATLARLHLDPARLANIAVELNGILDHVEALRAADTTGAAALDDQPVGMPLRADNNTQRPLATSREAFAPAMRDGFFLVPRLATHEDTGE